MFLKARLTTALTVGPILIAALLFAAEARKPPADPRVSSVFPMGAQPGAATRVILRGANLQRARTVQFTDPALSARIAGAKADGKDTDLLEIDLTTPPNAKPGKYKFRVVTDQGVTNECVWAILADPAIAEGDTLPAKLPVIVNGRITQRGEQDAYWIDANANQTLTFEVTSGFGGFDPSIGLWKPAATFFDAERLERIAFNDEPLFFPGLDTSARLVHTFDKPGRYCLKIGAFSGQGGPDYTYQLRILPGETPAPALHPTERSAWDERTFIRRANREWMDQMAVRGLTKPLNALETYRAVPEGTPDIPVMAVPGVVEGKLTKPADAHYIRLKLDKPQDLAIEIETPAATMPRFNPVVRVMQPDGHELVTDVYTKRNNNGLYMMKMIQAKTTVTIRAAGEYLIQIRDITTDVWAPDFQYRVLIRPQIAHVGKVDIPQDRVNLEPGHSKPVTVNIEREEGFKGFVAVAVEGLPAGVMAITGMENPIERPPLPNAGRLERYIGIPQTSTVMLVAAPDAHPTDLPSRARVLVRPVVDGKLGEVIATKELPVMVVNRRPS